MFGVVDWCAVAAICFRGGAASERRKRDRMSRPEEVCAVPHTNKQTHREHMQSQPSDIFNYSL